jgi:hypothetical protein
VAPVVGSGADCFYGESAVWGEAFGFLLMNLVSVSVKMFSHLIYFIKKFYKRYIVRKCDMKILMLQLIELLFNTKSFAPVNCDYHIPGYNYKKTGNLNLDPCVFKVNIRPIRLSSLMCL